MRNEQQLIPGQMMKVPLGIVGGNHFGRYPKIGNERTWNMMVSDNALVPFPGYEAKVELMAGGDAREIYFSPRFQHFIVVVGAQVFAVTTAFAVTEIGSINTNSGNVFISENENAEIAIVDSTTNIYVYNYVLNAFTVVPVGFRAASIVYQDGYLIAADADTNSWRLSETNNAMSWPATAPFQGALQSKAGDVVQIVAQLNRAIFVMGETVTETWFDTGTQLFPYQRSNSNTIDYGVLNAETVATGFNMCVWFGSNEKSGPNIFVTTGGQPEKISDDGMNFIFSHLTAPEKSFGFLYNIDGHICYQLTFTTDNLTFVYDFTEKLFYSLSDNKLNHHIAKRLAYANNKYYFISFEDSKIYEMSSDFYTYDGEEIPRIRIEKNLRFPDASRFLINNANVTLEQGLDQADQSVELSISRDGGYSFQTVGTKVLKTIGNRPNQFIWFQLGAANDAVLQWRFYSAGRFVVIGGQLTIIPGVQF